VSIAAFRDPKPEPLSLFPTRAIWALALNNQLSVPPAFDGERVYFGIEGERLVAYTLLDGEQQWLVAAQPLLQPAVGDGLVFSVEPDSIVARRVSDGSVAWRLEQHETFPVPLASDLGWLVAATSNGSILTFRATDGQLVWRREIESPARAVPALSGDRVYVPTEDGRVVALSVDTGAAVWERRLGGPVSEVIVFKDRLYAGSQDNFMYCLMTKNGSVDWRWRTGGDVIGLPAVDEHHVYFVSLDNVLRSLDRVSGVQQWMRALPIRPVWGPVKIVDRLVVAGQSSVMQAYNVKDGTPGGSLDPGADVAAPPHIVDDPVSKLPTVIVVTRDLAKGAAAQLVTRRLDPMSSILTEPLPNVISMSPAKPKR
jgi:outer membrane protein assembly factor BamB